VILVCLVLLSVEKGARWQVSRYFLRQSLVW